MRTVIVIAAALVLTLSILVIGRSGDDDEATPEPTAAATTEPVDTLPTSETVKIAIYERAYSECASTELNALAAKYNLVNTTDRVLAAGVANAWVEYFQAGRDAVPEGRNGCLQGLKARD